MTGHSAKFIARNPAPSPLDDPGDLEDMGDLVDIDAEHAALLDDL